MKVSELSHSDERFLSVSSGEDDIYSSVNNYSESGSVEIIGRSEEGRPLVAVVLGSGPQRVSLLAGAHADEPVGPDTLRRLIPSLINHADNLDGLLSRFTFYIIPHVNPDGEARNREWIDRWPDQTAYIEHVTRELPGRDVEFSYPDRRVENKIVSTWLKSNGPFDLHMSLHGMGFSDGVMLLIEKNWSYRTESLQAGFAEAASAAGLRLHDHNRKGEKGFFQIAPGFTTTPEGSAMRTYFLSRNDHKFAALFGDSSMEYIRKLGGDPLSLVTELPLFVVKGAAQPGVPTAYLEFRNNLPELRLKITGGGNIEEAVERFGLDPLPISVAFKLQLTALELGLEAVLSE